MEYEAVIGLKIHARFTTQSKPWCGCANAFGAEPNTKVCPVCLGLASAGSRSAFHPECEFHHA